MLRRLVLASLLAPALAFGCSTTVTEERAPRGHAPAVAPTVAPTSTAPVESCAVEGGKCSIHGAGCCDGLFCADPGYGPGTCAALQPNGGYCSGGSGCQSGICNEGTCVDMLPACVDVGVYCGDGAPCCAGFCRPPSYAPDSQTCAPFQPEGASCGESTECESGLCSLGTCRAADCGVIGSSCFNESSCCEGFCTGGPYSYAPGVCTTPQPAGAYCQTSMWCASLSCVDSVCAM